MVPNAAPKPLLDQVEAMHGAAFKLQLEVKRPCVMCFVLLQWGLQLIFCVFFCNREKLVDW